MLTLDVSNDGSFKIGTEYNFSIMSLRLGEQQGALSFGGGILIKKSLAIDIAVVNQPDLGLSQKVSIGYKFGTAKEEKKVDNYAREFLENGIAALNQRDYVTAAKSLETALGIDPKIGIEGGWKEKTRRLRAVVRTMGLEDRPEWQVTFKTQSDQAIEGQKAMTAFLDNDEQKAMIYAHVTRGINPRDPAFQAMLIAMSQLSRLEIHKEDILPPDVFVEHKLQESVGMVYHRQFDTAENMLSDALVLDPKNVMAWMRLGSAYFASGDKKNARDAWIKALEIDPSNEKLRQFMAQQGLQ
jgi:tetratricopeptide (TPR) repeat protein